jgi:dTDP-4-amino-4,6-dideoxygalactose transaminase
MNLLSGDGPFNQKTQKWLEHHFGAPLVVLTPSCTAALEMSMLLMNVKAGDEVIVPSFTFSSTATAVVLVGAIPVFVDCDPQTLNIDPDKITAAISPKTKGMIIMHYAGVSCDMARIQKIAKSHGLFVVEDAAQCIGAQYQGQKIGTQSSTAAFSFHHTKNISCGEGGCLVINDPDLVERAEIIRDKGTNRRQFFRGQVDKYTWVDVGSSYLMSDLQAEYLLNQLQSLETITKKRLDIWRSYHEGLRDLDEKDLIQRMHVPEACAINGHIYYFLMPTASQAISVIKDLQEQGIKAISHYVPLHASPAGKKFGWASGDIFHASDVAPRLVRLPISPDMSTQEVERVITETRAAVQVSQN